MREIKDMPLNTKTQKLHPSRRMMWHDVVALSARLTIGQSEDIKIKVSKPLNGKMRLIKAPIFSKPLIFLTKLSKNS